MLISPNSFLGERGIIQPLGIASIAAELENNGYYGKVTLLDGSYLSKKYGYKESFEIIDEKIKQDRPYIVGCTYHDGTKYGTASACCASLSIGSHLVLGGHGVTARDKDVAEFLHNTSRDFNSSSRTAVVRGEGEKTMKEIVDALFANDEMHKIDGVTFHDGNGIVSTPDREPLDLNELDPPAFHLLPDISEYNNELPVEESRGCTGECSFCTIRVVHPELRLKSPERVRVEVENVSDKDVKIVDLIGQSTLLNKDRALEIADIMEEFGYMWGMSAHPSLIVNQKKIIPILKEKGLIAIETGIEAATQRSLDIFNKHSTPNINRDAIKILKNNELEARLDFINFHPFMNMRDLYWNIMLMAKTNFYFYNGPNYLYSLGHSWIPHVNTPLYERAEKDGLIIKGDERLEYKFKDERVNKVRKSYEYFLETYGDSYVEHNKKVLKMCDKEHEGEKAYHDKRVGFMAGIPLNVMYIAYECAMSNISAKKYIDYLVRRYFEDINRENFESDILVETAEMMDKEIMSLKSKK